MAALETSSAALPRQRTIGCALDAHSPVFLSVQTVVDGENPAPVGTPHHNSSWK
jgi:hypothetical protein